MKVRQKIRSKLSTVFLAVILLSLVLISKSASTASLTDFTVLGTHPEAAAQSTSEGKMISTVKIINGKVYMGYGDYGANTGPMEINPFDLTDNQFDGSQVSLSSEAINTFTEIDGQIYVPTIDPQCSGSCPGGYAKGEPWTAGYPVTAEHIFDIQTYDGTDVWMFGSTGGDTAAAWRSTDSGDNWTLVRTYQSAIPSGTERFYWGRTIDGKMYMQPHNNTDGYGPVQIYDNGVWSTGSSDPLFTASNGSLPARVIEYDGQLVGPDGAENGVGGFGSITRFDGSTITRHTTPDHCTYTDADTANGYFYLLTYCSQTQQKQLVRTTNFEDWYNVATMPSDAQSLDIYQDQLYIGTTNSELLVSDETLSEILSATDGGSANFCSNNVYDISGQVIPASLSVNGSGVFFSGYQATNQNNFEFRKLNFQSGTVSANQNTPPDIVFSLDQNFTQNGSIWMSRVINGGSWVLSEFNPSSNQYTDYPIASAPSSVPLVRTDTAGNVWAVTDTDPILHLQNSVVTSLPMPAGMNDPNDQINAIAPAPGGNLWILGSGPDINTNTITKLALVSPSGDLLEFNELPEYSNMSTPNRLITDNQNNVWFTFTNSNTVVRFNPTTEVFESILLPSPDYQAEDITVGPEGEVWISSFDNSGQSDYLTFFKIEPSLLITSYPTTHQHLSAGSFAGFNIVSDDAGRIWFPTFTGDESDPDTITSQIGFVSEACLGLPAVSPVSDPGGDGSGISANNASSISTALASTGKSYLAWLALALLLVVLSCFRLIYRLSRS